MKTNINNKCKAFTSLEQSKRLAEILPLESADMLFQLGEDKYADSIRVHLTKEHWEQMMPDINPCWSLYALLNVINKTYYVTLLHDGIMWNILVIHHDIDKCNHTIHADSPVDACYEMILKLHELEML